MKQAHIFYSGHVQGVGFRFTAQRIAFSFGLFGWVRNTEDGKVEALIEGPENEINKFQAEIASKFEGFIRDQQVTINLATKQYSNFQIVN